LEINCKIKCTDANTNQGKVHKLYQVLFWQEDFTTIDIYTGVVLGNANTELTTSFGFDLSYEIDNLSESNISITDITTNFVEDNQGQGWKAVWGKSGSLVEKEVEKLKTAYKEVNKDGDAESKITTFISKINFNDSVFLKIISSDKVDNNFSGIAYAKGGQINNNKISIKQDISEFPKSINLINWHKATINLTDDLQKTLAKGKEIEYYLSICRNGNDGNDKTTCDDITFFVVFPQKYDWKQIHPNTFIKAKVEKPIEEKPIYNAFVEIVKKIKSNYFTVWHENEKIEDRQYYQLIRHRELKETDNELRFIFRAENNISPLYIQLFFTLLASIVVAYGLDSTRLKDLKEYFPPFLIPEIFYAAIFIPLIILLSQYFIDAILNREPKVKLFSFKNPILYSLILSIIWFLSIFIIAAITESNATLHFPIGTKSDLIKFCRCFFFVVFLVNVGVLIYLSAKGRKK